MRFARTLRRRSIKQVFSLAFVLFTTLEIIQVLRCLPRLTATPSAPRRSERIYIASIHWNNEAILRSHWNDAVVSLANALGRENVFVTV